MVRLFQYLVRHPRGAGLCDLSVQIGAAGVEWRVRLLDTADGVQHLVDRHHVHARQGSGCRGRRTRCTCRRSGVGTGGVTESAVEVTATQGQAQPPTVSGERRIPGEPASGSSSSATCWCSGCSLRRSCINVASARSVRSFAPDAQYRDRTDEYPCPAHQFTASGDGVARDARIRAAGCRWLLIGCTGVWTDIRRAEGRRVQREGQRGSFSGAERLLHVLLHPHGLAPAPRRDRNRRPGRAAGADPPR